MSELNENRANDTKSNLDNNIVGDEKAVKNISRKKNLVFLNGVVDYVELFVIAICAVLVLFSVAFRTCTVDGDSMNNTLIDEEVLIVSDLFYTPQREDIIVFHQTGDSIYDKNYPLVKRVIGVGGDTVTIDFSSWTVSVTDINGSTVILDEPYITVDKEYPHKLSGIHEFVVPKGTVFVLGDNRNHSLDSTDQTAIGFVDTRRILGRVIVRISPLSKFGSVD